MGVVGLSLSDFMALTPRECNAVCEAYHEDREQRERSAWEQTRIAAYSSVSPWMKHKGNPAKFLPLPWDGKKGRIEKEKGRTDSVRNMNALAELASLANG